ncbi:hypothetical protein L6E12_16995 [Actinokineospora sp. PR83]|uniref:hypothetical protein n=1 Tax=Actinokineospora sp. PR83 TaxID=2884908 RepID=UPI001F221C63|nr:hypothetical protein [Actinokineospora sp. PR83]MCG8917484.1 hypothetical protein [Actinokineospora sp. PR83]
MTTTPDVARPQVVVRGVHGEGIGDYATDRITTALTHHGVVARHVRITVSLDPDPAVGRPATASADIGVDGGLHVRATAPTPRDAVDLLRHRLLRRLASAHRPQDHRGPRPPQGSAGRHRVVAHSLYAAAPVSVAAAVEHLDDLDADHLLFTHTTGTDCLLRRTPCGYELSAVSGEPPVAPPELPVRGVGYPAPGLTETQARLRLEVSGEQSLFYADAADGRGHLVLRRADGDIEEIGPDR